MQIILVLLALLLYPQAPARQEQQATSFTTAKVAKAVKAKESGWDFIPGICTCPPMFSGQKSQSVGKWERTIDGGEREVVMMDIYEIDSAEEASEGMRRYDRGELGASCRIEKYRLGDEAYRLFCPNDPSNTIKVSNSISMRKGNYIIQVAGGDQETVERFAKYALDQLPAN